MGFGTRSPWGYVTENALGSPFRPTAAKHFLGHFTSYLLKPFEIVKFRKRYIIDNTKKRQWSSF
jgi:hypothetical protein